jgi:hypothetical protein
MLTILVLAYLEVLHPTSVLDSEHARPTEVELPGSERRRGALGLKADDRATMAEQQAIGEAVQRISGQVRGV